ncbi:peptidylprolyl isomerase [Haloferula sp. A504]|uniref:peptidylprolyl isomerase n=1 Tax=Haloferula sp. A504 TaxID=3373601 RepID=UPI0031C5ACEE|nr:peptidylprolyl isomerase [Verrucomicrobiaceae bacterium E54]
MAPSKKFTVRLALYTIVTLYLGADMFLFNGPVHRHFQAARPDSESAFEYARSKGMVARVGGTPIYLSQVERATRERLWLRGRDIDELTPEQRRTERLAALNDLIDHELLRVKVNANTDSLPVSEEEIDDAIKRLASRFANREEMKNELAAEGIDSEKELRYRLAARLQQTKYVESQIADEIRVTDEEARQWFEKHRDRFDLPLRVRARHVFLATLDRDSEEAKATLEKALTELKAGTKDFATLAAELSDDLKTKHSGGDLGWMTEGRLPADFGHAAFEMKPQRPTLIRTKIGWHIVEVTDRRAAETRSFEDARGEVVAALESARRIEMVPRLREALRNDPDAVTVHVLTDMISSE